MGGKGCARPRCAPLHSGQSWGALHVNVVAAANVTFVAADDAATGHCDDDALCRTAAPRQRRGRANRERWRLEPRHRAARAGLYTAFQCSIRAALRRAAHHCTRGSRGGRGNLKAKGPGAIWRLVCCFQCGCRGAVEASRRRR